MHSDEVITLGNNLTPPLVDIKTTQDIYDCVRTDEFEVEVFNALLMAIVAYLEKHDVDYGDKALPWAEVVGEA